MSDLLDLACRLATQGGDVASAGRRADLHALDARAAMGALTKSSATDVVTRHDRAAEQVIVAALVDARPDDEIVGEEGSRRPGRSGVAWHLDPIDGTTNFLYGIPMWSTSVAAVDASGPIAGAVYVPDTGELFAAERARGATRNGRPISASSESRLDLALVGTGFSYLPDRRLRQARLFAGVAPRIRDVRRMGSAAIDLVYTAAGFLDGYYEEHLNSWDMAAGELIAREAGCRSGDFSGGPARPSQLLVAAPGVYDGLQALLSGLERSLDAQFPA
jgi:myo-inositol-1(or 4)-monophosphatase